MTAKALLLRLLAPLFGVTLMTSLAVAEGPMKGADFLRVVADQMHQLQIVKVGTLCVPRAKVGNRSDRIQ